MPAGTGLLFDDQASLPLPCMTAIRWGLCCQFVDAPVRFRTATHRYVASLAPAVRRDYLSSIARANAIALAHAVERCAALGIGAFRITSQIVPLATHPESGYALGELDQGDVITRAFQAAGELARLRDVRLSFHPDQFVVLNSEREEVVRASLAELEFHGEIAELVGADVLCLHGGGAAGGIDAARDRLARGIDRLSARARSRLVLENDDRLFAVRDLLPVCERSGVPLVYDVHHHRCHPDGLSVEEATGWAAATWYGREPYMHLSSPRDGWGSANPRPHAAFVDPADVPPTWLDRRITVDVEAKDKERAVVQLMRDLADRPATGADATHATGDGPAHLELRVAARPSTGSR
jgi:UV DNA damage endonuclease